MRKKYMMIGLAGVVVGMLLSSAAVVLAGNLGSPSPPGATSSYTLEDIYNRLHDGTQGSPSTFTEPASGPTAGSGHTLDEIMAQAPEAVDYQYGATAAHVLSGKTFWGLTPDLGTWGPRTGSMPDREAYNASTYQAAEQGKIYFEAPAGYYDGSDWVSATNAQVRALDADFVAGNIKSGVKIFGVTGSYACTGNATTEDVLYPKTFSNSSSEGLTGQRYGGCTCTCATCTLNGTRWCDNGDGTVTDLLGYTDEGDGRCLVWVKDASWGGEKPWEDCINDDDAHGRAASYEAGPYARWRLPTWGELHGLTHGVEAVTSDTPRAFTGLGVYDMCWSSTASGSPDHRAVAVALSGTYEAPLSKWMDYCVWPVRNGQ
jgi:hypothetical protein